jgi:predicted ATP-dependent endonuclease of OLD family
MEADATLHFEKGLNIVAGASDTGKSFILDTIDYMMGAGKSLEGLDELEKFDTLYMEIRTFESELAYTIKRDLEGGSFYIKLGSIAQNGDEVKYAPRSSSTNEQNISSFLLGLVGLNSIQLTCSDSTKKTRKLSFRDVAHITLINEVKMFTKDSPLLSGNPATKTAERSFFEYLISQTDSSQVIKVEKEEIRKTRLNAQIEYVKSRLKGDRERLVAVESSLEHSQSLKVEDLASINEKYTAYFRELEENKLGRKKAID